MFKGINIEDKYEVSFFFYLVSDLKPKKNFFFLLSDIYLSYA